MSLRFERETLDPGVLMHKGNASSDGLPGRHQLRCCHELLCILTMAQLRYTPRRETRPPNHPPALADPKHRCSCCLVESLRLFRLCSCGG